MSTRTVTRRTREIRPRGVTEFPFTEADVRHVSAALGEPAWLLELRLAAWQGYQATPMPTLKDEAWRRTDLSGLPAQGVTRRPAEDIPIDREITFQHPADRRYILVFPWEGVTIVGNTSRPRVAGPEMYSPERV